MRRRAKRFRALVLTLVAITAVNYAISIAGTFKSSIPVIPDAPRPKSSIPVIPDAPRPKSSIPVIPDAPRP